MSKLIDGKKYIFSNAKGEVYIGTFELCSSNIFCGKNEKYNNHETYHEASAMNIIYCLSDLKTKVLNELNAISCDASVDGSAERVVFFEDYENAVSSAFDNFEIKKAG